MVFITLNHPLFRKILGNRAILKGQNPICSLKIETICYNRAIS